MRDRTDQPLSVRPTRPRVVLMVAAVLLLLVVAGCGADAAEPSVPDGASAPHPANTALDESSQRAPTPTNESASTFGADIVARLNQEAFYASDSLFADPFVHPDAHHEVVGEMNQRVEDLRWAIATFPGATHRSWFVASPLTVNVTDFDAQAGTATVEVWVVTVFSREDLGSVDSRFYTERADLTWDGTGWLITKLASSAGPSASLALDEAPTTPADLDELLEGHDLITGRIPGTKGT